MLPSVYQEKENKNKANDKNNSILEVVLFVIITFKIRIEWNIQST